MRYRIFCPRWETTHTHVAWARRYFCRPTTLGVSLALALLFCTWFPWSWASGWHPTLLIPPARPIVDPAPDDSLHSSSGSTSPAPYAIEAFPSKDQDFHSTRVYEAASLASYAVLAFLAVVSLGVPLLAQHYGQHIDGLQNTLNALGTIRPPGSKCSPETLKRWTRWRKHLLSRSDRILRDLQRTGFGLTLPFITVIVTAVLIQLLIAWVVLFRPQAIGEFGILYKLLALAAILSVVITVAVLMLGRRRFYKQRLFLIRGVARLYRTAEPVGNPE